MRLFITRDYARINQLQTCLLVVGLALLVALAGWLVGGADFMFTMVGIILVFVIVAPYVSPRLVLHLHKAELLTAVDSPSLYALVGELTQRAMLSHQPRLYYLPSQTTHAFTVGLNKNAAIALSDELLRRMNRRELKAILAHEISHIKNQDMRIMATADAMVQLVRLLSALGLLWLLFTLPLSLFAQQAMPWLAVVLLIVLPSITMMMKMKLSRTREFEADRMAASLTRDSHALIAALSRLEYREWRWFTELFMPTREKSGLSQLRTHPDTDERIERLKKQAEKIGCAPDSFTEFALNQIGLGRIMPRHVWELNKRKLWRQRHNYN